MGTSNSVNRIISTTRHVQHETFFYAIVFIFALKIAPSCATLKHFKVHTRKTRFNSKSCEQNFFFGFSSKKKTSVLFWAAKFLALHFAPLLSLSAFSLESCPTVLVLCFGVSSFCFQRCESGEIEHLLSEPRKNFLPFDHVRYTLVIAVGF